MVGDPYEPVRLGRGVTTDSEFVGWAESVARYPNTSELGFQVASEDLRKPMQIELYDQAGRLAVRYDVYDCWASEYVALPDLAGDANVVALASMTIEHEGWERATTDARDI